MTDVGDSNLVAGVGSSSLVADVGGSNLGVEDEEVEDFEAERVNRFVGIAWKRNCWMLVWDFDGDRVGSACGLTLGIMRRFNEVMKVYK